MRSTHPPITVPAWTAMMASRDPGELGFYGFRNRKDHSYDGYSFANSTQVKVPRLWDRLGAAGRRSIVLGVPQTYPPSPLAGEMVTCFLTPSTQSQYTYPAELKAEVERVTDGYVLDVEDFRTADKERLLRRVYDKHVAGVNKAEAPSSSGERGTSAYDRVIRPQRIGNLSREASAEYHYENGLHELGPAFATKYIGTHLRALRDQVAGEFIDKATMLPAGASEPRFIMYNGERYYRPDVAREMRDAGQKSVKDYDRYDPTAGEKFPVPAEGKYLGPRELVKTLNDFGRREESQPGSLRRWFQEQIIGFGFGIPHVANIMRRVSQTVPGGAINPKGWVDAWKVALGKELRAAEEAEAEAAKAAAKVEADAAAAAEAEALRAAEGAAKPSATPNFSDPSKAPSADFEWKGRDPNTPGRKGNWVNPKTGEKFNPDLNHPGPIGPHYDYTDPSGGQWRVFPDGRIMPK